MQLQFLYQIVSNENHPYFPILTRLAPLRPSPLWYQYRVTSPPRPNQIERNVFVDIYSCTSCRADDVDIDEARALFPVLDLKWVSGWTLQQEMRQIADSYPEEQDILIKYCEDGEIDFVLSSSDDLSSSLLILGLKC